MGGYGVQVNQANIKDVAKMAGVSSSTVSRVLAGKVNINSETSKKVLKSAKELNYTPNIMAQSLKMGRSNTVALLVPSIKNHIFPEIARGVEDVARKNGITLVLCNTDEDIGVEINYIENLKKRNIDGFIVSSMMPNSDHIRKLAKDGFPLVLSLRHYDDGIDTIAIDNKKAAFDVVEYLIKMGHKKIALVLGRSELNIYKYRYEGYVEALKKHGIALDEKLVIRETAGRDNIYFLVKSMLERGVVPDAIFATSDPKAIVVMRAVRDAGFSIPGDISVMGFDNIDISSIIEPPLSTVSQPLYKIGSIAMQKLIDQINAKEAKEPYYPRVDIIDTELIIRNSTK